MNEQVEAYQRSRRTRVSVSKSFLGAMILMLTWSAEVYGEDSTSDCKEVILESGQRACVRTRVVSRRVVRRERVSAETYRKMERDAAAEAAKTERQSTPPVKEKTTQPKTSYVQQARSAPAVGTHVPTREFDVDEDGRKATLRIEGVTEVPLLVGAGFLFESKRRFRLKSSLGVMPKGYVRMSNNLIQNVVDGYPDAATIVIEQGIDESIVWRSQVGVRPFRRAGLYLHTGYTLLGFQGSTTGVELSAAAAALNNDQGELVQSMDAERVALGSRLHMVDAELGWDFRLGDKAHLRFGLGWAYTFYSKTRVTADFGEDSAMDTDQQELFEEVSGKYLDAIYREFVHPPSVALAFGLNF